MAYRRIVLLTGATGFLGRYLLRDLLASGQRTAVLTRNSHGEHAGDRIEQVLDFWSTSLGRALPRPVVIQGDLRETGLGLSSADRRWLGNHCRSVLHAAANLSFLSSIDDEPWKTNVQGTQALLRLACELGIPQWHHISTAFVCGRRSGLVREADLDVGQTFHNPYEESKLQAEKCVREAKGICATVYRPSVIVGDSRTGYTSSFLGFYRFVELADRLANLEKGNRRLPMALQLVGDELCDLVPVDWVSRAILELHDCPLEGGRTFHLVSRSPLTSRFVKEIAASELGIQGIEFVGSASNESPGPRKEMLLEGLREYWPYLGGTPAFCCRNTIQSLPHLPAPAIDEPMLRRLVRFALDNRFGRAAKPTVKPLLRLANCVDYIERVFPEQARFSNVARAIGLTTLVSIDIQGKGGGAWTCRWRDGELVQVRRGLDETAIATYRTDTSTFEQIITGKQNPQQAFFDERIAIEGDLEVALMLASLLQQFVHEQAKKRETTCRRAFSVA